MTRADWVSARRVRALALSTRNSNEGADMSRTVVLEDGPFRIEWNGGRTFNVYALDKEVNVFSADYGGPTPTLDQAKNEAREWWEGDGKSDTQLTIREMNY